MITSAICLSHSPLLERARADRTVELAFRAAVANAADDLATADADLVVVFYPDHLNGFFHGKVPDFATGLSANALGDYGTAPGELSVPAQLVQSLADSLAAHGVAIAVVPELLVDHGATQALELLENRVPVIPIFINCIVAPRPDFRAVEALGAAVGAWAQASDMRIAIVGSGGLSHDPPLPPRPEADGSADEGSRPRVLNHGDRVARQARVYAAAQPFAQGGATLSRPLAPEWDAAFMDALSNGQTGFGNDWIDEQVTEAAGSGGHEVRCWIASFAALGAAGGFAVRHRFYAPVPEWLTGMGVLTATPHSAGKDRDRD